MRYPVANGLGRSLGHCRPALPKGRKYQMVKTQTESHDRRPKVWTDQWQNWVPFPFEVFKETVRIYHTSLRVYHFKDSFIAHCERSLGSNFAQKCTHKLTRWKDHLKNAYSIRHRGHRGIIYFSVWSPGIPWTVVLKGQLISKCPFAIVVWTKYQRKCFQDFCHERLYRQGK